METEIGYAIFGFFIGILSIVIYKKATNKYKRSTAKRFTYIPPNRFNIKIQIDDIDVIGWAFHNKSIAYKYVTVRFLRNINIDSIEHDCEKEYEITYWT